MSRFLETDIGKQEKYEKKIHISVDYTVYDLCHEIKFENRVENKDNFIFFYSLKSIFFGFPENSIALEFFAEADTRKKVDMSWQKSRHLSSAEANFERCIN